MKLIARGLIFLLAFAAGALQAEPLSVRWTAAEDKNSEFLHVIETLNRHTGFRLSASDFILVDDRDLANNHYKMFIQTAAGIPLSQRSIRLWTDLKTKELIQAEALVESDQQVIKLKTKLQRMFTLLSRVHPLERQKYFNQMAMGLIKNHPDDPQVRELSGQDLWEKGQLIHLVTAKAKHGTHRIKIQMDSLKVLSQTYVPYAHADEEFSLPALVFPIYEETEKQGLQNRVVAQLKHLKRNIKAIGQDPYAPLRLRHYLNSYQDPVLGLTEQGQADGYWAMTDIKAKAAILYNKLSPLENSFANGGVILEGRYATVNIHPDAVKAFAGIHFTPKPSSIFKPSWQLMANSGLRDAYEMVPSSALLGRPLTFFEEAYQRPARRLPDHNPVEYINDGFDEVQVYYAINALVESLHQIGFTDPELSTRPFHAFLYDPDIGSRDNAYYTDDTINFTTYSPQAQNYARDNSTIWHELGHGIMDRLMGDSVQLADTGGLSEGMADFVAALVIEKVTKGQAFEGSEDFRIVNNMGFSLTNEVHDDGESYGGSMRDILIQARTKYGVNGVVKVGDLTMETMRFCRNHPGITAEIWFNHMLFADALGNQPTRAPGELKELILAALAHRNFTLDGKNRAQFKIVYDGKELNSVDPGSRERPIPLTLAPDQKATYTMQVSAVDGESYKFAYPLTVRVQLQQGPLQGALHWDGEENNTVDYILQGPEDQLTLNLSVSGKCDYVNRQDGSCVDFAYIQLWPQGAKSPVAKKRFYLKLLPSSQK